MESRARSGGSTDRSYPRDWLASGEVTPIESERYGLLMAREVIALADRFLVTSQSAARLARIEAGPDLASRVGSCGIRHRAPPIRGQRAL